MSVKKGPRTLLDIAKDAALQQVHTSPAGSKYLLLTNDKPLSYQPLPADKIIAAINNIDVSAASRNDKQTISTVQSLLQTEGNNNAELYYYSDFQKSSFDAAPDPSLLKYIYFKGIPIQAPEVQNIYIDTAYLNSPVLQTGQNNQLIVHTKYSGKAPKEAPVLQLSVNGQVKSAATLSFSNKNESTDTLNFRVNDANWQRIVLTINDASIAFDDTFRITARSTPNLSILVLNEGQASPYIQAAFKAYNGFRLTQTAIQNATKDWNAYNLIIINGVTRMNAELGKTITASLQNGQSICILPGKTNNTSQLNEGLREIEDIQITGLDTSVQTASNLQQGSDLVKGLFEKIPDNVQLPTANWHYMVHSGLSANGQSIISFRNGDPFIVAYKPSKGILYICATSADLGAGNFPGSYFFAPFLYQMAMQAHTSDVYALTAGTGQAAHVPLKNTDQRDMIHLYNSSIDIIPIQHAEGSGINVYIDQSVQQPGFYLLAAKNGDSTAIPLNANRNESEMEIWSTDALKEQWKGENISWLNINDNGQLRGNDNNGFPLWKVCVILALVMLAAETFLLAGSIRKKTVATQ